MDRSYIAIIEHSENQFSGIERRYHPMPDGSDRWIRGFEDARRWPTREIAIEKLIEGIHEYLITLENEGYILACRTPMPSNYMSVPDRLRVLQEWNERRKGG